MYSVGIECLTDALVIGPAIFGSSRGESCQTHIARQIPRSHPATFRTMDEKDMDRFPPFDGYSTVLANVSVERHYTIPTIGFMMP